MSTLRERRLAAVASLEDARRCLGALETRELGRSQHLFTDASFMERVGIDLERASRILRSAEEENEKQT